MVVKYRSGDPGCNYCHRTAIIDENGFCDVCGKRNFHRTATKVWLNPWLRKIGWQIVSLIDGNEKFVRYELRRFRHENLD